MSWENDLSAYLTTLSTAQQRTLDVLGRKRQLLAGGDREGLEAIAGEEAAVAAELQECLHQRQVLLDRAAGEGLPADSLRSLAGSLPANHRLGGQLRQSTAQARLLQHEGLVNWVVVQKTLLHLSQLLEIIATRGRMQPTYNRGEPLQATGALVDQEV